MLRNGLLERDHSRLVTMLRQGVAGVRDVDRPAPLAEQAFLLEAALFERGWPVHVLDAENLERWRGAGDEVASAIRVAQLTIELGLSTHEVHIYVR